MNKPHLSLRFSPMLLLLVSLGNISLAQAADEPQPQQLQEIDSLQRRASALTYGNLDPNGYYLAKARIWLDLAQSEYYEKDSSGIISAAIGQATTLLDALETKQPNISMETPLEIAGGKAIRPDLLEKISTLKKHEKFSCGQRPIAEAEVYLVWAGHEFRESGKSHAEADIRAVENMIYDGEVAINNCMGPAPSPVQVPVPLPVPVMETITISSDGLFAFDKATLNPSALSRLDELTASIKEMGIGLEQVNLIGHTDRLRSDGRPERNRILSEQRAESIKRYLVSKGIPADKIHASGMGSTQPVVQCSTKASKEKQIACLQPNRRVEIILRGKNAVDEKRNK
jgi:OOP family OmpA-OmpF porin